MGNSNDNKLISTAWLGVNDDWRAIMKDRISWINEEWAQQLMTCLRKCSFKEQQTFQNNIKEILTRKDNLREQYNEQFLQVLALCRKNNDYLRQEMRIPSNANEQTMSTSQSSGTVSQQILVPRINESHEYLSQSQKNLDPDTQSFFAYQSYIVFEKIHEMINSLNHPFYHMISAFQKWMARELNEIKSNNYNIAIQKKMITQFGIQVNEFIKLQIFGLNEYLGDFDENSENRYLKDKQNYFNLFLSQIIGETQTIQLLDILQLIYQQNIIKMKEKMVNLCNQTEFFEIPKQYLNKSFQQQIDCLTELQFLKNPAEKQSCLVKTYSLIKEQLSKSASNLLLLHVTNYVIVHSRISNFQAHIHLLDLFYSSSPILLRFNQSLEFIQNIII